MKTFMTFAGLQVVGQIAVAYLFFLSGAAWDDTPRHSLTLCAAYVLVFMAGLAFLIVYNEDN